MSKANTLTLDLKTVDRINKAVLKVGTLQKRVRPKYQEFTTKGSSVIRWVLTNAREYVLVNVGKHPPLDHHMVFEHSAGTLERIEKAREYLRAMWSLIPPSKQREAENAHAIVAQVLKDLRSHVKAMMSAEG